MRRSASPSKASRASTPVRAGVRDAPSSASSSVLKTPFKPLSGLEGRRKPAIARDASSASKPASTLGGGGGGKFGAAARDVRTRTTTELQDEIADMQMILSEKLIAHNAARTAAGRTPQQPDQIVAEYIKLLTEYNRVRDAAQVVFDKIADIEQLPAKDIHARYGVGD